MATNEENNIASQLKPLFPKHNFNKLYYKQDVVTFTINGELGFYQAIRDVPRFIKITDRRYWNLLTTGEGNFDDDESNQTTGPDYLCFTANENDSTLNMICYIGDEYAEEEEETNNSSSKSIDVTTNDMTPHKNPPFVLEYSIDKINWSILNMYQLGNNGDFALLSDTISFENAGDKIYFRGDNINGTYYDNGDNDWYGAVFVSQNDSTFSVSGDLQTIVDSTGNDKEHGCFNSLFMGKNGFVLITSAPDLTATSFIDYKYKSLFDGQSELLHPATMPNITISDLENVAAVFYNMYSESGIQEPANFNNITINSETDYRIIEDNFGGIYNSTTFDITNDNITLNGFEGIDCPSESLAYELANILGNTNGFNLGNAYSYHAEVRIVGGTVYNIVAPESVYVFNSVIHYNDDAIGEEIQIQANGDSGTSFSNWEVSYDNGSTWEDVSNDVVEIKGSKPYSAQLIFNLPSTSCIIRGTYSYPMS